MNVVLELNSQNIKNDNAQAMMVYNIARKHTLLQYLEIRRKTDVPGEYCRCLTWGEDDGNQTCWPHHDCRKGDCTHGE